MARSWCEILGQKRAQRLIFPGLDVARRPVVEQARPAICFRLGRCRWLAKVIALADPYAELQLVVEPLAPARGLDRRARPEVADRPDARTAGPRRGSTSPAVIADGS